MATEFSMLSIMNAALLAVGWQEVASENDGTEEFLALQRNWPGIVEAELEAGNYYFTKAEYNLLTRIDGKFGYDDGYMIPAEALHVRRLWIEDAQGNRCDVPWVQDGQYVYLDYTNGCHVQILIAQTTDLWSANFVRGVQKKLEAVLLRIGGESSDAERAEQAAEMAFQTARTVSSRSRSQRPIARVSRFARARFNR